MSRFYDGATNGKGKLWYSFAGGNDSVGSDVEKTLFSSYDALGRPLVLQQRFKLNGAWVPQTYQVTRVYNLAGGVTSQIYPSGNSVTYNYDNAGRLADKDAQNLAFTGNLGGVPRTYAKGISYASGGQLKQEQFGTTTPVYNKLFYNSRQQLAEILASTTGSNDSWNRGKILNQYSLQCSGAGCNASDNNGNLRKQEVFIPGNDQVTSYTSWYQQYDYDELNRLKRVHEYTGTPSLDWQQEFNYDRWGNRTLSATGTWVGNQNNPPHLLLNEMQCDTGALASSNRLYAPGDLALAENQRRMRYDAAGNLTNDTYTGAGERAYDAENRMTKAWGGTNQWQYYTYNADGQRTRRKIDSQETWQIYGFEGELLAEYAANAAVDNPQKEYGYRNGQLLITATPSSVHSLSLNGSSAYAQVPNSSSLNIAAAITVEAWVKVNSTGAYQDIITRESYGQSGTGGGYELSVTNLGKPRLDLYQTPTTYTTVIGSTTISTGVWHHVAGVFDGSQMRVYLDGVLDGTLSTSNGPVSGTSSLKIGRTSGGNYFNGLIDEARVSNSAVYSSNFTPQQHLTASGSTKGLWKFDGPTPNDSSGNANNGSLQGGAVYATDVPAGPAYYSGSFNGSSAYVQVPNSSSLNITAAITVEAWIKINSTGAYQDIITRESWGQSGTGGGYELSVTNLGKARLDLYQSPTTYTTVIGSTTISTGVWHHVAGVFDGSQMRVYLNGVLDGTLSTSNAPASGTSSLKIGRTSGGNYFNGLIDEARVSNSAVYSSNFTPLQHITVSGSTKGLWKFDSQSPNDASANGNHGTLQGATYSDDVPGGGGGGGGAAVGPQAQWLLSDHLGTPRMVFDQTGSLANAKRHDYLPFGEELIGLGLRSTTSLGYSGSNDVRQQFTQKERDVETGLDYFGARYFSSTQGRFTGVDPAAIKKRQLINPQDLNRFAYVANNPLAYIDPNGEEKIKVIVRTFIPDKTVSMPHPKGGIRTFEGDNRDIGKSGTYRTQQIITIETDPQKNNGSPIYGKPERDTGVTVEHGWIWNSSKKASGDSLEAAVKRDKNVVSIKVKGDENNPLVMGSPAITYDLMIGIQSEGPKGNVTVTVNGHHDGFPAYEILIVRPETGDNSEKLVYGHDPRTTGQSALSLAPPAEFEAKKKCVQKPGGECQ